MLWNKESSENLSTPDSVVDAGKLIVQGVSAGTTTTVGMATLFSYLPIVLGSCASAFGIVLTYYLIRQSKKKIKLYDIQIAIARGEEFEED